MKTLFGLILLAALAACGADGEPVTPVALAPGEALLLVLEV